MAENDTGQSKGKQFPCGSCGAKLEFSPGKSSLKCPYCSHENKIPQTVNEVEELDFYEYFARAAEQGECLETSTVKCGSCSAASTVQPNVSMSHCPFCGSQLQAKAKPTRLIQPGAILPFKVTKEKALEEFRSWLGSLWFAPGGLMEYARKEGGIKGMYLPAWTFDSQTTTVYDGERGENYYETEYYEDEDSNGNSVTKSRRVTHTRWYHANGTVWNRFDDVLVLAGNSLPPDIMESLEPWDLKNVVPFQEEYLSGFQAEAYQLDLGEGFERAKTEMDSAIMKSIESDIGGDHQRVHNHRSQFDDITFKHLLLPVWISAYRFGDRSYRFIINARTGEVQGERPWSVAKIALTAAAVVIVLIIIVLMLKK